MAEESRLLDDDRWNRAARGETPAERLDRNWRDLLQELRVVQLGVQLLTALLLTVPFKRAFLDLAPRQVLVYAVTAALAAGLLIAPVVVHRSVFRHGGRQQMVAAGQWLVVAGLTTFGLAIVGVVALIADVVLGPVVAVLAAGLALVLFGSLWGVVPAVVRRSVRN
ncbi:DUF6328 family protein [Pseudonocardia halophobica]|uniref:Sodium:proton antiporter n=1 Tax=Pseudonocardia halophobica TaxID=29401 RepID=A0A9W6NUE9_9PSEU|nr:DUF6328 family protein [Pseudonocardia halophobica]GLL09371.1 hypothetical protein GCM10017577_05110 [Pseudonocardia halophobica]